MKTVSPIINVLHACSEEFKMTNCEAYGKQVFEPHPWDQARARSASDQKEYYETIATTDRAYDKVNVPANCETGYEAVTTTDTGYEAVTKM